MPTPENPRRDSPAAHRWRWNGLWRRGALYCAQGRVFDEDPVLDAYMPPDRDEGENTNVQPTAAYQSGPGPILHLCHHCEGAGCEVCEEKGDWWNARYATIVADPPWRYQKDTSMGTKPGGAEGQYDTLGMREIAALPIRDLAADNAHLYLWVTVPRLHGDRDDRSFAPIDIMEAWGFKFKTMLTWVKPGRGGMGWYFRGQTEHVLFGVRGQLPIPPPLREPNVIFAPRSRHSKKPDAFFDLVERVSPGPYLELFARSKRSGWDAWGNEIDSDLEVVA